MSGTGPTQHLEILKNKIELNKVAKLIHFVFLENDLADGNHNWSVTCADDLGNPTTSITGNFSINQPDLYINNSMIELLQKK